MDGFTACQRALPCRWCRDSQQVTGTEPNKTAPSGAVLPLWYLFFDLHRSLPVGDMTLGHPGDDEFVLAHFAGDRGTGADGRSLAHRHRRHQLGVRADKDVILDDGLVLVGAIVVAGDGTGANIHIGTNLAVAQIAQMTRLGAKPEGGILDLDEVADMGLFPQHGTRTQPGERTDRGGACNLDDSITV